MRFEGGLAPAAGVRPVIIASIPIILVGLLVVVFAMLRAPWPADPPSPATRGTVSFVGRVLGEQGNPPAAEGDRSAAWYARRVLDGLTAVLVIAACAAVGLLLISPRQELVAALTVGALLGVLYGASTGLYGGPMMTAGGFACVMFGAGLGWATWLHSDALPSSRLSNTETGK